MTELQNREKANGVREIKIGKTSYCVRNNVAKTAENESQLLRFIKRLITQEISRN